MKYIKNCIKKDVVPDINSTYLTVTGYIVHRDYLKVLISKIEHLKCKYWENGLSNYKQGIRRVCFHSRDIRKKEGPFYLETKIYKDFMDDLTYFLKSIKGYIISININKYKLCRRYSDPYDPYEISSKFLIERYARFLSFKHSNGIIMLEARGVKEDKAILESLKNNIQHGTGERGRTYIDPSTFYQVICGVYFNPKWSIEDNYEKSYYGLEIADLLSYPIHSYVRSNLLIKSRPFKVLESKLIHYPDYFGVGLKVFPK